MTSPLGRPVCGPARDAIHDLAWEQLTVQVGSQIINKSGYRMYINDRLRSVLIAIKRKRLQYAK